LGSHIPLLNRLLRFYREVKHYARILNAGPIARRMFVTNSFDGLLSSLGVVLGSYLSGAENPSTYVGGVVGASFAMGFFSGVVATYLSERAERMRELKQTERALLHTLKGSIYERAARIVPFYVALWSGIGAIVLPVVAVFPFILASMLHISVPVSLLVYTSAAIILAELFLLGVYLGRISGENVWVNGVKLAGIGLAAVAFFALISVIA
jgi:predicted membrane protein (TIGR00267 family)